MQNLLTLPVAALIYCAVALNASQIPPPPPHAQHRPQYTQYSGADNQQHSQSDTTNSKTQPPRFDAPPHAQSWQQQGMQSPPQQGMQQQGMKPSPHQGMQPPPHQGMQPPPHQGMQPSPHQGMQPPPHQGMQPPPHQGMQPSPQQGMQHHPNPQYVQQMPPAPYRGAFTPPAQPANEGGGFFSRIKNSIAAAGSALTDTISSLGGEEDEDTHGYGGAGFGPMHPSYPPHAQQLPYQQTQNQQQSAPHHGEQPGGQNWPPQAQSVPHYAQQQLHQYGSNEKAPLPPQQFGQYQSYGMPPSQQQMHPLYDYSGQLEPAVPVQLTQEEIDEETVQKEPPEPQVFSHANSIVMVLKPKELCRKKLAMRRGGAGDFQVLMDFENVMTAFKANGERTLRSAELLENSGAIQQAAVEQMNSALDDYEQMQGDVVDEYTASEELFARLQQIIARDGGLHIASVQPVTRDGIAKLGLREGWKKTLRTLSAKAVPTYVFSDGYGDVVAQALLTGLQGDSSPTDSASAASGYAGAAPAGIHLPQNLRIISNFFRTAPDGTVRAFSHPIVHERNKNASTAAAHMGMPIPSRPNALVIGSDEEDVGMTTGLSGLQEQLSIGYLALTDDFLQRLPVFLSSFDVVVIGDGTFEYVRSLIDQILNLDQDAAAGSGGDAGATGKLSPTALGAQIGSGLRRVGMLFSGNQQHSHQPQSPNLQHQQFPAQSSNQGFDSSAYSGQQQHRPPQYNSRPGTFQQQKYPQQQPPQQPPLGSSYVDSWGI